MVRLGGPALGQYEDPASWIDVMKRCPYTATSCPCDPSAPDELVREYEQAALRAGIVIAETGAWSNPLSNDPAERAGALEKCKSNLALADRIGALVCVNISGSRGEQWDGPDARNLTADTFDMIVESVREIIDAVKPKRTYYSLETMPWAYPDSPESYVELIKAVERPRFAVHLDPVNLVNSPRAYYENAALIRHCFDALSPHIKSCHAKDIVLSGRLTVHLDEVRPGLGMLDYSVYLRELNRLPSEVPLLLEHMPSEQDYRDAAEYIRSVAKTEGIEIGI
jgi:sugar phosphate isomerase/epimerase